MDFLPVNTLSVNSDSQVKYINSLKVIINGKIKIPFEGTRKHRNSASR